MFKPTKCLYTEVCEPLINSKAVDHRQDIGRIVIFRNLKRKYNAVRHGVGLSMQYNIDYSMQLVWFKAIKMLK